MNVAATLSGFAKPEVDLAGVVAMYIGFYGGAFVYYEADQLQETRLEGDQ